MMSSSSSSSSLQLALQLLALLMLLALPICSTSPADAIKSTNSDVDARRPSTSTGTSSTVSTAAPQPKKQQSQQLPGAAKLATSAADECAAAATDVDMLWRRPNGHQVPHVARELDFDQEVRLKLGTGRARRLRFVIVQPSPLTIRITVPGNVQLVRKLFYNENVSLLSACPNGTHAFTLPCARHGRYDLLLWLRPAAGVGAGAGGAYRAGGDVRTPRVVVGVLAVRYNRNANWSPLDNLQATIRHHNRVQRRQMTVKWDVDRKVDANAVHYCLVVGSQRNQRSLCSALCTTTDQWLANLHVADHQGHRQRRSNQTIVNISPSADTADPLVVCTARKNRQQLGGLQPNRRYYLDVFGVHTRLDGLTVRLASTSVWFNRSQPIELPDDQLVTTKLADLGRQTVFSYRVGTREAAESPAAGPVLLQVLPCGVVLQVRVYRRKVLLAEQEVDRALTMRVAAVGAGDRLVVKVSTADKFEFRRSQLVGIAATIGSRFTGLPELPNNTSVEEISSSCQSTTIAWYSSPDSRLALRYCVTVARVSSQTYFNQDLSTASVCQMPQQGYTQCFRPVQPQTAVQSYDVVGLDAGSQYSVHVAVQMDNHSLPFEMLQLRPSPYCYRMDGGGEVEDGHGMVADDVGEVDENAVTEMVENGQEVPTMMAID